MTGFATPNQIMIGQSVYENLDSANKIKFKKGEGITLTLLQETNIVYMVVLMPYILNKKETHV